VTANASVVLSSRRCGPLDRGAGFRSREADPHHEELESLLLGTAGVGLTLPDLSYYWHEGDIRETADEGSIWVVHREMIYYFIHWGLIEVDSITPEYAAERIPKIWPGEGLQVLQTQPMTVAGHPAIYVDVLPRREFYRAHFLIWNCPETGRQFMADMNYNVSYGTPISELQAEIDATTKTLACHLGAPTSTVPGHVARYDEPRFSISFSHPLNWYVFESPYAVPHPACGGVRNDSIGSLLAWPKDGRVRIGFVRKPKPERAEADTLAMVGDVERFRPAAGAIGELEEVESFVPEASEPLTARGYQLVKVVGLVRRTVPEDSPSNFMPDGRGAVLLVDDERSAKRLFIIVWIDNYLLNGQSLCPDRHIFDGWARDLVAGLRG
jgi:hypothetical protein